MNFFKSVFSDDPDRNTQVSASDSHRDEEDEENDDDPDQDSSPNVQNSDSGPIPTSPLNFFKSIFSDDPDPKTQGFASNSPRSEEDEAIDDDPDQDSSLNLQNSDSGPIPTSPLNFFKSIFSDDPDPKTQGSASNSPRSEEDEANDDDPDQDSSPNARESDPEPNPNSFVGGGWNFGGLVKTLATKSESVIETYRRDLKEFGSGLKKETVTFREVAKRAVKELPTSIEAGASKAQGSIETVGQVIDGFGSTVWKGTTQIISQGKDALLTIDEESDSSENQNYSNQSYNSKKYSRFDARVRKIQSELSTFCDEPEDLEDYKKWKSGFLLEEKDEELERLFEENGAMEEVYNRIVPNEIDHETFWARYFFKVYKLEQADYARAKLLKRAISIEDEEDLSWDVDDDDDDDDDVGGGGKGDEDNVSSKAKEFENRELGGEDLRSVLKEESLVGESQVGDSDVNEKGKNGDEEINVPMKVDEVEKKELGEKDSPQIVKADNSVDESLVGRSGDVDEKKGENMSNMDNGSKNIVVDSSSSDNDSNKKSQVEGTSELKSDEKMALEGRGDRDESSKDGDFTVVSSQPSLPEEEDLGWDEIEDLGSGDEKKVTHGGSPSKADLRKRLSAAEEEEDLSWDIEDDDEPIKA